MLRGGHRVRADVLIHSGSGGYADNLSLLGLGLLGLATGAHSPPPEALPQGRPRLGCDGDSGVGAIPCFRHMLPAGLGPNLAFIGCAAPCAGSAVVEALQAHWLQVGGCVERGVRSHSSRLVGARTCVCILPPSVLNPKPKTQKGHVVWACLRREEGGRARRCGPLEAEGNPVPKP